MDFHTDINTSNYFLQGEKLLRIKIGVLVVEGEHNKYKYIFREVFSIFWLRQILHWHII